MSFIVSILRSLCCFSKPADHEHYYAPAPAPVSSYSTGYVSQIPRSAPIVHRYDTMPRKCTTFSESLEWKHDTVRAKGRDGYRQPLMYDSSLGTNPKNQTHYRDIWYGDEPWYGEEYDKWEPKYLI